MLFNLLAIEINVERFVSSLPYVGIGMLGIFIVIGIIIIATMALIAIENKIKASKKAKEEVNQNEQ
ncbi:MAG: hypothetical protein IKA85_06270 [Clostridia bacterium]|nr:hypothetical protein [Clostridia bacterium]